MMKKLLTILLVSAISTMALGMPTVYQQWLLDDGAGNTAADAMGIKDATLTTVGAGTMPAWTTGYNGGALEFFGDGTADAGYAVADMTMTGGFLTSEQFAMTAWIYSDATQGSHTGIISNRFEAASTGTDGASDITALLISAGDAATYPYSGWTYQGLPNQLGYMNGANNFFHDSGIFVPNDQWVFVGMTLNADGANPGYVAMFMYDPIAGTCQWAELGPGFNYDYENYLLVYDQAAGYPYATTEFYYPTIGMDLYGGSTKAFDGKIDEPTIWDGAFTPETLSQYLGGVAVDVSYVPEPATIALLALGFVGLRRRK